MAAYYTKTPTGQGEITITQRTLTFTAGLVALLGALFSAGISYGVMQAQLDGKVDAAVYAEGLRAAERRIDRADAVITVILEDVADLKTTAAKIDTRVTDIACDLIRPRRAYCR